ncbi:hypothetical protein C8Q73DRAFT_331024 [Cubamyces lactineus]|nr:hypothetical protein C8Q73DRAFT_331024 [Cubamyces lactineus]
MATLVKFVQVTLTAAGAVLIYRSCGKPSSTTILTTVLALNSYAPASLHWFLSTLRTTRTTWIVWKMFLQRSAGRAGRNRRPTDSSP